MTASELEEFESYARRHNLTNAEVIKRGIRMQFEEEGKKSNSKK